MVAVHLRSNFADSSRTVEGAKVNQIHFFIYPSTGCYLLFLSTHMSMKIRTRSFKNGTKREENEFSGFALVRQRRRFGFFCINGEEKCRKRKGNTGH